MNASMEPKVNNNYEFIKTQLLQYTGRDYGHNLAGGIDLMAKVLVISSYFSHALQYMQQKGVNGKLTIEHLPEFNRLLENTIYFIKRSVVGFAEFYSNEFPQLRFENKGDININEAELIQIDFNDIDSITFRMEMPVLHKILPN